MKTAFSLRRSAIIIIAVLIIIAILNVIISLRITTTLADYAVQSSFLDKIGTAGDDVMYQVVHIQESFTDVIVTGNREGLKEAEEHFQKAQSLLNDLNKQMPASKATFDDARNKLTELNDVGKKMVETYLTKGQKAGNAIMQAPTDGFDARSTTLLATMQNFVVPVEDKNEVVKAEWRKKRNQLRTIILAQNVFSILAFIFALLFIGRKLFSTMGGEPAAMLKVANEIARGNLAEHITVKENDRTSLLANLSDMQCNLRKLIAQIKQATEAITTGTQEISAGNINLSQRTEEQASSLEETASSMEEMASTVKQNAENAKQANMMAMEASHVAVKAGEVVNQVIGTMAGINSSSKKIVDIISVIDGIAFQTNILALNAAVEAARAGEQGRGFAVVAAEVRSLAQRSATAAKEIKQLIGDSVEKVSEGTLLVQEAGTTMEEVVISVKLVTDIVNEIAAASLEQSAGIDQVNNAITNMDEVTQQNAALVEQAAAAAAALEMKAQELTDATSLFILTHDDDQLATKNSSNANLNELQQPTSTEPPSARLTSTKPAAKRNRLKSPKMKVDESHDWEEF